MGWSRRPIWWYPTTAASASTPPHHRQPRLTHGRSSSFRYTAYLFLGSGLWIDYNENFLLFFLL